MSNRLVPLPTKPHVILPKRRAVPPLSGAPPKNHDVAAVLFTLALVGAAWPYRHVIFRGGDLVSGSRLVLALRIIRWSRGSRWASSAGC